jgi:hypothetical protein
MVSIERSSMNTGESLSLEPLPKNKQAINFAKVHGIVTAMNGPGGISYRGRLNLKDAFHNASAWPTNFPVMGAINSCYGEDSGKLLLSAPYDSAIKHELVGFEEEYSSTHWGILPTTWDDNPFNIMRIWRIGVGEFPVGANHPLGLYVAQPKKGGELAYFAVSKKSGTDELQVMESLDESLTISLMHEVRRAAEVMTDYKRTIANVDPEWIAKVLARYPHPTSYLDPVFSNSRYRQ